MNMNLFIMFVVHISEVLNIEIDLCSTMHFARTDLKVLAEIGYFLCNKPYTFSNINARQMKRAL